MPVRVRSKSVAVTTVGHQFSSKRTVVSTAKEDPPRRLFGLSRVRSFVRSFGADERSSITNSPVASSAAPFLALGIADRGRAKQRRADRPRSEGNRSAGRSVGRSAGVAATSCHAIAFPLKVALFSSVAGRALFSLSLAPSFFPSRARAGAMSCCGQAFSRCHEG